MGFKGHRGEADFVEAYDFEVAGGGLGSGLDTDAVELEEAGNRRPFARDVVALGDGDFGFGDGGADQTDLNVAGLGKVAEDGSAEGAALVGFGFEE